MKKNIILVLCLFLVTIVGCQNLKKEFISETDDEIIARLNKGNKESVEGLV